jgi:hypothetical protein
MRELDRLMIEELHIELLQMMENAGRAPWPSRHARWSAVLCTARRSSYRGSDSNGTISVAKRVLSGGLVR